jgi:hypothetical protein
MMSGVSLDNLDFLNQSPTIRKLKTIVVDNIKNNSNGKTGKLWIQLLDMVSIMKNFIKAERMGNWMLHLESTLKMLPFFAATGHNNYMKSSYLYVQNMLKLADENKNVHEKFLNGLHVGRITDKLWAGLSHNLIIEQELMRAMKSTGNENF